MELEIAAERIIYLNNLKILFEDSLKTISHILCNDVEILILDHMLERSKEGDLEIKDEQLSQIFKFEKKTLNSALINLSKGKFIEIKEKNLGTVDAVTPANILKSDLKNNNIRFAKKMEKIYRLNSHFKKEFPNLLEKFRKLIQLDLRYDYVCPVCNHNYKDEEVFQTNPKLIQGKFLCLDVICRSYLQKMTDEEIRSSNTIMNKIFEVMEIIQSKFDLIKDKEWPFKKRVVTTNGETRDMLQWASAVNKAGEARDKLETDESNRETWVYKMFKLKYFEKYHKNFDYVQYLEKGSSKNRSEIVRKLEDAQKKVLDAANQKKIITPRIILENRKRLANKNDLEYDRIYKKFKK